MKPENPPAFPRDDRYLGHNGMDLRDYFAGQAATMTPPSYWYGPGGGDLLTTPEAIAKRAYAIADALLSARQETRHGE